MSTAISSNSSETRLRKRKAFGMVCIALGRLPNDRARPKQAKQGWRDFGRLSGWHKEFRHWPCLAATKAASKSRSLAAFRTLRRDPSERTASFTSSNWFSVDGWFGLTSKAITLAFGLL